MTGTKMLIEPLAQVERTPSGLHLVEHHPNQMYWVVLAVGPKCKDVSAGEHIIAHSFHGHLAVLENNQRVIEEKDVIAKMLFGAEALKEEEKLSSNPA